MIIADAILIALATLVGYALGRFHERDMRISHESPRDVTQDLRSVLRGRR